MGCKIDVQPHIELHQHRLSSLTLFLDELPQTESKGGIRLSQLHSPLQTYYTRQSKVHFLLQIHPLSQR